MARRLSDAASHITTVEFSYPVATTPVLVSQVTQRAFPASAFAHGSGFASWIGHRTRQPLSRAAAIESARGDHARSRTAASHLSTLLHWSVAAFQILIDLSLLPEANRWPSNAQAAVLTSSV